MEQNTTTHTLLLSLNESLQRKAALESSGGIAVPTPAMSGEGNVAVTPATGRLEYHSLPPIIWVQALDEEIREKKAAVLRHLLEDDPAWMTASQVAAQRSRQAAATQTAAAISQIPGMVQTRPGVPTDEKDQPIE